MALHTAVASSALPSTPGHATRAPLGVHRHDERELAHNRGAEPTLRLGRSTGGDTNRKDGKIDRDDADALSALPTSSLQDAQAVLVAVTAHPSRCAEWVPTSADMLPSTDAYLAARLTPTAMGAAVASTAPPPPTAQQAANDGSPTSAHPCPPALAVVADVARALTHRYALLSPAPHGPSCWHGIEAVAEDALGLAPLSDEVSIELACRMLGCGWRWVGLCPSSWPVGCSAADGGGWVCAASGCRVSAGQRFNGAAATRCAAKL